MKKFLSLILMLSMLLCMLTPCAFGAESSLTLSEYTFSPSDTNRLYIYVAVTGKNIDCDITISNSNGDTVAVFSRDGMKTNTYTFIWNAKPAENNPAGYSANNFVPAGTYTVTADCGGAGCSSADVRIGSSVAASAYGNDERGIPNYTGYADVDYMAECILDEIGIDGKSNYEIVRDVYTWVQAHGYRKNSTYIIYEDDSLNTLYFDLDALASEIAEAGEYYDSLHESGIINYDVDGNLFVENARQMMVYEIGTCLEFSSLLQVLLNHVGIECWVGGGYFRNSNGSTVIHKWNLIRINGTYYWSDVRIDNADYERSGRTKLYYNYFLDSSTSSWEGRHIWDRSEFPYRDTATPAMPALEGSFVSSSSSVDTLSVTDGENKEALLSTAGVMIDGLDYSFEAYCIDGYNYFRLRDIAFALSGSGSQFSVGWNGTLNCISLVCGEPYSVVGGELDNNGIARLTAIPTPSRIIYNGNEIALAGYLINGNNYFRLRDLGTLFDFEIGWDGDNGVITISTAK